MRFRSARRWRRIVITAVIVAPMTFGSAEDAVTRLASFETPAPLAPEVQAPPGPPEDSPAVVPGELVMEPSGPLVSAGPFPVPSGYATRVEFWKNVFGVWSRRQVALHDSLYPGLVYDVIELPDEPGSPDSVAFVRARQQELEARLKRLEVMVQSAVPLTDDEKSLALLVTTRAGTEAILRASLRVRTQRGIRERFRRGLEISARYDAAFRRVFRDAGLPEDLACLPHIESSFENIARSSAGAVGMWQFTRPAAKRFLNLTATVDERFDPLAAARGAARYLDRAYKLLGSWPMAVTSYNHGVEGMLNAKGRFETDFDEIVRSYDGRAFGFASKNFYAEFLAAREIAKDPAPFFPEGLNWEPPLFLDEVVLPAAASPTRIAQRYQIPASDLAALNPSWTQRALRNDRPIPSGVSVWLPGGTLEKLAARAAAKTKLAKATRPSAPAPVAGADPTGTAGLLDFAVHVVRRGETLFKIASLHGVTLENLLDANRLTERSILHPGQELKVPKLR